MDASNNFIHLSSFNIFHKDAPSIVAQNETIIIFLNVGSKFANNLDFTIGENNIDFSAIEIIERYVATNNLEIQEWIYPQNQGSTSLTEIMAHLKIPAPSPLGIRVNQEYGSWWAFRGVIRVKGIVAGKTLDIAQNACMDCRSHACIKACPSEALRFDHVPDMYRCANFRLKNDSPCFNTCVARLACPFGMQYQYSTELMNYIYENSLEGLKKWLALNSKK